ncbi:pyridoxamine 5'-phosphate oxidase family protein [Rhodococcus sp. NPDC056960]|uniref:pyridoxamine 5'-phosphate oxidase family protein n=1 Tax=Rhodococcus sp. NPDC056960 TaxID=3345982 RepID=UPI00363C75DC
MNTATLDRLLTVHEATRLLRSVPTGRLLYTEDALPAVRPVTFTAPRGEVLIPTGPDPWFDRFDGTFLAFEAGELDVPSGTGWTVLVLGHARRSASGDPAGNGAAPTAPRPHENGHSHLVLDIERVTGRRITLAPGTVCESTMR